MAEERLFGNSIDQAVVNEIKKREKLFSKGGVSNTNILPDDAQNLKSLRYTTQRGAWVRIISSVDVRDNNNQFSPEVSKKFILTGGEITSDGRKKEGISFDNFDTTKSYRKTATLGVRPEAGITSFSIKHKGTYGSLREAEISFNVWSKEDLNRAQDIYLRPGVHMIIEWGHTIDSDINPVKLPNTTEYFKASTRGAIQELINAHRKENLSYEGFIGLVTNFSWSFREDGGYDCSVKIISAGAVMEALTTIQGAGSVTSAELIKMGISDEEKQSNHKKSLMHNFLLGVERVPGIFPTTDGRRTQEGLVTYSNNLPPKAFQVAGEVDGRNILVEIYSTEVKTILIQNNISLYGFAAGRGKDRVYFRYITIRDLLKFLNASEFFPKAPNGETPAKFYIEQLPPPLIRKEGIKSQYPKFKTFPEHFSLDIKTCILPQPPTVSDQDGNFDDKDFLDKITLKPELQNLFSTAIYEGESNNIQSILVELDFLLDSFDAALSSQEDNIYNLDVFSFIKNLLKGINNALGNITDLDLHFDVDRDAYIIVDREAITNKEDLKKVAELSFTGLSNTVQKVSIQTKITPQLSSQIAISAQGTNSIQQGDNNGSLPMIQWNAGIKDRFVGRSQVVSQPTEVASDPQSLRRAAFAEDPLPSRIQAIVSDAKIRDLSIDTFLKPWSDAFDKLVNGEKKGWFGLLGTRTAYRANLFSNVRRFGIAYFRDRYFKSIGGVDKEDKTSDPGLIPIELSVTLDGIGGLKIGQVFKLSQVDKFLPDVYKDYGFIITGLDNDIENNKWNTTIRALTFKIPK